MAERVPQPRRQRRVEVLKDERQEFLGQRVEHFVTVPKKIMDEVLSLLRVQDARLTALQREVSEMRAAVDEMRYPTPAIVKVQQLHSKLERLYVSEGHGEDRAK